MRTKSPGSSRRTFSLNRETVSRFEAIVPPGARSQTIEFLLKQCVEELERERLNQLIREGLEYMADVYADVEREWAGVETEAWPTHE